MTTATRPSRFSNFTVGSGNEKTSQPIGSTFSGSGWQSAGGIWGSGTIGSFNKRETTGSRGSDEAFPNSSSGSAALTATSEADPWGPRPGRWSSADNASTRNTSGSTSPNRTRDAASTLHDISNTSPYFVSSRPSIGQPAGNFGTRSKPSNGSETSAFRYGPAIGGDMGDEKENTGPFGMKYEMGLKRGAPEPPYLNAVGSGSRDPTLPATSHSEGGALPQQGVYGEGVPPFAAAYSGHSHRPSMTGPASFPQAASSRAYDANATVDEEELREKLRRSLTLGESGDAPVNGMGGLANYGNPSPQQFQFNPGSQPWEANMNVKGYGAGYGQDAYPESLVPPYLAGRRGGSGGGRGSPAGGPYRPSLHNSPRHFNGTPPGGVDPWARPSSRSSRFGQEPGGRAQGQHFMQQQQQQQQQQQPPPPQGYFAQPYYNPSFPSQYPHHLYSPYGTPSDFRSPVPIPGYGLPVNPYLAGAAGGAHARPGKEQDPARGIRSPLLEEFRSSSKSNKRYELKDIYNHIVEFSGDQHGSRFIQQKLESANSDEKDQVFREIEPNAVQLMKDVFGNYVIQKFFEHGNQVQKKVLAGQMKGKVVDLSMQMYACRVVQKALEHILVDQQAELVKELEPDVIRIMKDQNGNHVIQKIVELVSRDHIAFIMNSLRGQVSQLASHTYGCRVIQRMLEYGSEADKAAIMEDLQACSQLLITDQYGNYVIQHIIEHGKPEDRERIVRIVTSQLLTLSKHKFASNVVEKCIQYGSPDDRLRIRTELTAPGSDGTSALQVMMKDQYGNYVIQKLLSQLEGDERESFIQEMRPQFTSLKKVSNGRQIAAIDRLISAAATPPASVKSGGSASGTTPASPAMQQADAATNSVAPTPVLTMEPNSPQSSGPPSTNASAFGENAADEAGSKTTTAEAAAATDGAASCPEVRVDEA